MATRDTDENPRDGLLAAEQRLLIEGIPSYLDAMMAIQELQQTIQKRCRRVLREGLEAFAQAIGMSLLDANIEDVAEPNNVRVTDDGTFLGVKILLQNIGTAYVCLALWKDDDQISMCQGYVAIYFNDRALSVRAWECVRTQKPQPVRPDSWGIELYKSIPPDRIPNFEDILAELLGEWS